MTPKAREKTGCQFAEEKDDPQLLEETQVWMREHSYTLTDTESPEELRIWQDWLDFMEGQADNFHCGQKPEKLYVLQRQVMQGLRRHPGEHHPEALNARQKTVKAYLRAYEKITGGEDAFFDHLRREVSGLDQPPLGSEKKERLTYLDDPEFITGCCRDLVELYKLYLGREHPDTFEVMALLGRTYASVGWHEQAARRRWDALDVYSRLSAVQQKPFTEVKRTLMVGLVNDYERLEQWEQAVWAQEDYLSQITALGRNTDSGQKRLLELCLEWLGQDQTLTDQQARELLRTVLKKHTGTEDRSYRGRCVESARQWCQGNEHRVDADLWDAMEAAWRENDGGDE